MFTSKNSQYNPTLEDGRCAPGPQHFMYLFTDALKRNFLYRSVRVKNTEQKQLKSRIKELYYYTKSSEFISSFFSIYFLLFRPFRHQTTDGGGWTVFQRRLDGSVDFYRKWKEYKEGFGTAGGEYWLGLDNINRLTNQGRMLLRVDLSGKMLQSAHALYRDFTVSNEKLNYTLGIGSYTG